MAYSIISQAGSNGQTNEYRACIIGCLFCGEQVNKNSVGGACLEICKDFNFLNVTDANGNLDPIVKGVIEPDKACQMGCIEGLCQGVCIGGTIDTKVTKQNANDWWDGNPNHGCSIKTGSIRPGGYYSQEGTYAYYNAPLGSGGINTCCSNGMSLCAYTGRKGPNYNNVLGQAVNACKDVKGAGNTVKSICKFVNSVSNCGNKVTS